MAFTLFPAELRALPQWCVATLLPSVDDGKLDKAPYNPRTGGRASTTEPKTWGTFEQALATRDAWRATTAPNAEIGFVFNESDDFAVIDLDTYKAKVDDTRTLHANILAEANTYAELSQSGLGTHIIGRGRVETGANNEANALELYSHARFMICTGNPAGGMVKPVADIQDLLDELQRLLKRIAAGARASWRDLDEGGDEELSDAELVDRASNADNGDKFDRLCAGDMSDYNDDWSDADAALIQFLCFYTPNNEQVRRIFLMSKLATRDKAHRPDYIPRTITNMRDKLAQETLPEVDTSAMLERARALTTPATPSPVLAAPQEVLAPVSASVGDDEIPWPPGLVGQVARYIHAAAIRPVRAAAIAGGIATIAGIVGRQYNTSTRSGLNQYILYLAKTGTGKEAIQSGIDRLFAEVAKVSPQANLFLGPAHFASGQALVKRFQEQPSFVSIQGEFGHKLKVLTHPRAQGADRMTLQALLDLYSKSGWGQALRATVYSDKEKNTDTVVAPALTLLGEAEPEGFFAGLDESTISSGFLPRFLLIQHKGDRPDENEHVLSEPPAELVTAISDLIGNVVQMMQGQVCVTVGMTPEATKMLREFNRYADKQMRGEDTGDTVRQLWNRAHLKALRLTCLLAVGNNPYAPLATLEDAQWATNLINQDVTVLLERFVAGDVGEGDSKIQADLVNVIRTYLMKRPPRFAKYLDKGAIPIRHLSQATISRAAFKNHRMGSNRALRDALDGLEASGLLMRLSKKQAQEMFKTSSEVYALGDHWEA